MRILFMGTPDIAAESLNALIPAGTISALCLPAQISQLAANRF